MGKAKRNKAAREATAAYAASQPLFDAFRLGAARIGEQKANLYIARDVVQNLHIKLPSTTIHGQLSQDHQRYKTCAVNAWKSALEVYSRILDTLVQVTAADPTEGRQASAGHDAFLKMAETAKAARVVVLEYDAGGEKDEDDEDETSNSSDSDGESSTPPVPAPKMRPAQKKRQPQPAHRPKQEDAKAATELKTTSLSAKRSLPSDDQSAQKTEQPPLKVQRTSPPAIRVDDKGHKVLFERGASRPAVPFGTLDGTAKKAWRAEKSRQKREKKKLQGPVVKRHDAYAADKVRLEDVPDRRAPGLDYISVNGATASQSMPQVEYEDVSAEVEARLKAKETAKLAKREEKKKRKRESEGSLGADKPKDKKIKSDVQDSFADDDVVAREKKHKRKTEPVEAEKDDAGGRKKRKKETS